MKNVTVQDILEATGGRLLSGSSYTEIRHMSTDSRNIEEDTLFVPIVGANMDGHNYISQAVAKGAKAVLTAREDLFHELFPGSDCGDCAFVLVTDTTDAVQKVARMARTHLSLPAVGITGSVGKTTTREMVSAALSAGKSVYKTDKNFNNWLGVPITLCEMSDDYDIAVLELGLNVRGELGLISSLTNIETAVITNIGVAHIEFYGSQDEIAKEKFTITNGFWKENPNPKVLFLNADDPYLMKYKDLTGYPYLTYGLSEHADYQAGNVRMEEGQYVFDFYRNGAYLLTQRLSVLGEHNVKNACAALAIADHYQVDLLKASENLSAFGGFQNRLQRFYKGDLTVIDDTYNASPDSMKAGLLVLSGYEMKDPNGKKYAVLGDMFELGENAPAFHYEVGEFAAAVRGIDAFILVGEQSIEIMRALSEHAPYRMAYYCPNLEYAKKLVKETVQDGDVVYIKASHGMGLHEITEELMKDGE